MIYIILGIGANAAVPYFLLEPVDQLTDTQYLRVEMQSNMPSKSQ